MPLALDCICYCFQHFTVGCTSAKQRYEWVKPDYESLLVELMCADALNYFKIVLLYFPKVYIAFEPPCV